MSFFDSRVCDCSVWQVVLVKVMNACVKVDIKANAAGAKID